VHVLADASLTMAPWNVARFEDRLGEICMYHFHKFRLLGPGRAMLFEGFEVSDAVIAKVYEPYLATVAKEIALLGELGLLSAGTRALARRAVLECGAERQGAAAHQWVLAGCRAAISGRCPACRLSWKNRAHERPVSRVDADDGCSTRSDRPRGFKHGAADVRRRSAGVREATHGYAVVRFVRSESQQLTFAESRVT
jgi:hypothetical protein